MSIKGLDRIQNFVTGIGITTETIGVTLMIAGVIIGATALASSHGWPALATGLIASGGAIFVLGVGGGLLMMNRAYILREREEESIIKASQAYQQVKENL